MRLVYGHHLTQPDRESLSDSVYDKLFAKEAEICKRIQKNPHHHIVHIFNAALLNDSLFIQMEYVNGCMLSDLVDEQSIISETQTIGLNAVGTFVLLADVGCALAFCHAQDIFHRYHHHPENLHSLNS